MTNPSDKWMQKADELIFANSTGWIKRGPNEWVKLREAIARALEAEYERGFTDGRDDVAVERRERDAYARGEMAERERCAKVANTHARVVKILLDSGSAASPEFTRGCVFAATKIEAAIRKGEHHEG